MKKLIFFVALIMFFSSCLTPEENYCDKDIYRYLTVRSIMSVGGNTTIWTDNRNYLSTDGGNKWSKTTRAFRYLYSYVIHDSQIVASTEKGILTSLDGGLSWTGPVIGAPLGISTIINIGETYFVFGYDLYRSVLYRSMDRGMNWSVLSSNLPDNSYTYGSSITVLDSQIFVCRNGEVYSSKNLGVSWLELTLAISDTFVLESVLAIGNYLFAINYKIDLTERDMFMSADSGKTWALTGSKLGFHRFLSIGAEIYLFNFCGELLKFNGENWDFIGKPYERCEHPAFCVIGTNILVGTDDRGLFYSADSGKTWASKNNGFPLVSDCDR